MVISKDKKLKKKVRENDYGQARLCCICRKPIAAYEVKNDNFEYVKNKLRRKLRTQYVY